ncbi:hypothetical protein NQ652_18570, partial [Acinetobacter baumannii]|nr:hypothetical protein [Acinetobacter baumannii]
MTINAVYVTLCFEYFSINNLLHKYNKLKQKIAKKRRLPVYILIIVGLFLLALVVYMVADHSKTPKEEAAFQHE